MTPQISGNLRKAILEAPIYTPFLTEIESGGTALAMRVDESNLRTLKTPGLLIAVKLAVWRSAGGVYVIAVAFRANDDPEDPLEGDAYLNPRQRHDRRLLLNLSRQGRFPLLFLAPDFSSTIGKSISWKEEQRQAAGAALLLVEKDIGENYAEGFDRAFEAAKGEFQGLYSVEEILKNV